MKLQPNLSLISNLGDTQRTSGYGFGVKRSCANRTIHRVMHAILRQAPRFIRWPSHHEMRQSADLFFTAHGLPNIPLGVDGNYVHISSFF